MISPEAAPASFQAKFRSLSVKANLSQLKEIPVCIAPSREATHALVLKRHTKLPISKWEPVMQAKFYRQLIESGMSIEEIAKTSGQGESDVRSSLRDHHLYEMACRLKLPADIASKVHDPHSFSLSTLGRIFDVPEARTFFGIEVDTNGDIQGKIAEDEFVKGFEKVVTDVAKAEANSRNLNKSADVVTYLSAFPEKSKPSTKRKGNFTAATFGLSAKAQAGKTAPKKTPPIKVTSKLPVGLIPNTIPCNVNNQRVKNLYAELRRLSPENFPNACALSFRSFLEMSVYCFLDSKGEITKMAAEYRAEIASHNASHPNKPKQAQPHWSPDLNGMMKRLRDPKHGLISSGHITKALGKAIDDEQELFGLNLFTHNTTYHPDGASLRKTWIRFEELMKVILA